MIAQVLVGTAIAALPVLQGWQLRRMTNEDDDTMLDPAVLHRMLPIVCVLAGAPRTVLPCTAPCQPGFVQCSCPVCCGACLGSTAVGQVACSASAFSSLCPHSHLLFLPRRSGNARASAAAAVWLSAMSFEQFG